LVWAENVLRQTNKPVLILTPLAVAPQFVREGQKFGIEVHRVRDGKLVKGINVVNYQQLHKVDPEELGGCVADEASAIKHMDSRTSRDVIKFLQKVPYRLLCTATPAPNDYMELGTSSEALGAMTRNSMLGMFFTNGQDTTQQWVLKGHARTRFWQWCSTWARAVRKPADLGFPNGDYELPPLNIVRHVLPTTARRGFFARMATTLEEQRKEKRNTVAIRCAKVAEVLPRKRPCLVWCQLNDEGDELTRNIPGAVQVKGSDSDEEKEERLEGFALGQIRVLVTKPKIAAFGLNYQHCHDVSYFPSHSFEQHYQAIRRTWRFGQKHPVTCNLVYTEAEQLVADNMLRKERDSIALYEEITRYINDAVKGERKTEEAMIEMKLPKWL
jgi:hypothetical protein